MIRFTADKISVFVVEFCTKSMISRYLKDATEHNTDNHFSAHRSSFLLPYKKISIEATYHDYDMEA